MKRAETLRVIHRRQWRDHGAARRNLREAIGAGQRIGSAGGKTQDGESLEIERLAQQHDIIHDIHQAATAIARRHSVAGAINADQADAETSEDGIVRMAHVAIAPKVVEGDHGLAFSIAKLGESQSASILQLRLPRRRDLCQPEPSSLHHSAKRAEVNGNAATSID